MDDFDLRDLLAPPMRIRSDMMPAPAPDKDPHGEPIVLAMSYVPAQRWQELYEPEEGLRHGTIFRQLDLPFEGGGHR